MQATVSNQIDRPKAGMPDAGVPPRLRAAVLAIGAALVVALALLPPGTNPGGRTVASTVGRILGQVSLMVLLVSLALSSDRTVGRVLRRRWRLRAHTAVGVVLLALSLAHAAILPLVGVFRGWLSGVVALALLAAHGYSGGWKTRLLRRHGYARWRFLHLTTGWAGLLFSLEHALLFGHHLGFLSHLVE